MLDSQWLCDIDNFDEMYIEIIRESDSLIICIEESAYIEFVYPMTFLYSADQQVLTVGTVTSLIRGDVYKWGMLMAGALLAAAPPLVIYAFLMDYYIAGLTAGATKG